MLDFAIRLAREASGIIRENSTRHPRVFLKGRKEVVTDIDRMVEEHIVSGIAKTFPDHGILSEEGTDMKGSSSMTWIVDPLDGTANLIREIPWYSVSIALADGPEVVLGVCANPITGDLFWASRGKGAFRNGSAIHVSGTGSLDDAVVAVGLPFRPCGGDRLVSKLGLVLERVRGVRRFGSAALDFCCVASGALDLLWEEGLEPWDMAAGALMVREAGGTVTRIDGSPFDLYKKDVAAGNPLLHGEMVRCLNPEP
jgi:myo-inositol-1(or 4)-monophosphatase